MLEYAVPGREIRGHYWKRRSLPFRHTCIRLCYKCMLTIVIIVKDITHYIIITGMRFYSCNYLSLSITKNAPQIQQPHTAYDFWNINKPEYCERPIHQEASNKISSKSGQKQRSYSIFSNEVKIAKFSYFFFCIQDPNFRLFSTFYSDFKSSR